MSNTFTFGEQLFRHQHGNWKCPACRWDEPKLCPDCGEGRIHIELNTKNKDEPVFIFHCDLCAGRGKEWKDGIKV